MESLTRKVPFSLEAEQSIIGSVLLDPAKFDDIAEYGLSVSDFYLEEHRDIYSAMQKLYLESRNIDLVTLIDTLVSDGIQDRDRSIAYIKTITEIVPSAANVRDYVRIVKDKALKRKIIEVCEQSCDNAYTDADDAFTLLDAVSGNIYALADNVIKKDFRHIREVLVETYGEIKKRGSGDPASNGVGTGFSALDDVLVGMSAGDLVLIGARPGMGKTALAINIAVNAARNTQKSVCIFSLEMSSPQLALRMLSSEARIDSHSLREGKLQSEDWKKLADASSYLSACNIFIDDTPGIGVSTMRAKLRRIKNLGMIVIDYLQLMQSDGKKNESRVNEVGDISRNLKLLAKELGVPVICCAQLSRGPEQRDSKKPMLSDLRDSGAIEQDADVVMFIYREEYYKEDTKKQNEAEIIIAKNRHGSLKNVKLSWHPEFTRFATMSDRQDED